MAEPTCRICYAMTLTAQQRERFFAEPVTAPSHFCDQHKMLDLIEKVNAGLSGKIIWSGSVTGRFKPNHPPLEFQRITKDTPRYGHEEGEDPDDCDHLWVAGGLDADWVCEHCPEVRNS